MSRFLVLGSQGFIGSYLVNSLLLDGHEIYGYNRSMSEGFYQNGYRALLGDFSTELKFEDILSEYKIDAVLHMISTTVPREQTSHIEKEILENVLPTIRLLEAMSKTKTKKIIFTSSGGTVYGEKNNKAGVLSMTDPVCSYGIQKLTIEKYLALYHRMNGIDYRIARISNPYGVTLKEKTQGIIPILINNILTGREISLFGNTIRDYIHVQDLVSCLKKIIDYEGKQRIFNVGSGRGVRLNYLIRLIEGIAHKKLNISKRYPIRSCDVEKNVLDVSLTKKELNWEPEIPLELGIETLVHQLKNKKNNVFNSGSF